MLALLLATVSALQPPPVILLNGLAGSVIDAKLDHLQSVPHVYCSRDTRHKFDQLWVSADELLPGVIDCMFDNIHLVILASKPIQTLLPDGCAHVSCVRALVWCTALQYVDPQILE